MSTQPNSLSPRRAKILQVLKENGESMQIREIVRKTDLDYNNARSALSEMTSMNLLTRVHRGVYDLPERVSKQEMESPDHPLQKILLNQQILKVLLNIVITNKALMETLLLGQQEIINTIRRITAENEEGEEAVKNLEEIFARRVEWHFDIAAEQVAEQYTKLPEEVFDVLVAPLTRDKDAENKRASIPERTSPGRKDKKRVK
jgi:DNA-binding transcriptional ArsR family regulator